MNNESMIYNCVLYARVSTKNEGQAESCANQIELCRDYVKSQGNMKIIGEYIDDGSTGSSDLRAAFTEMLQRLYEGDISYIITKNDTRISRSTEVSGLITHICMEHSIKIIYAETGEVYDPTNGNSVTLAAIKAALAQDVIFKQSQAGRTAHRQKCASKKLDATDIRYGYRWDKETKCIVPYEPEAAVIRQLFQMYTYRGMGEREIARKFAEQGIVGTRSGKMLQAVTLTKWLTDPAYKGVFYINKKGTNLIIGTGAKKKRYTRPREEWIACEGPAIISEELFDLAQRIHEENIHVFNKDADKTAMVGRFNGKHLFAGKIFCGGCGSPFQYDCADRARTIGIYKDTKSHIKNPIDKCSNTENRRIREDVLIEVCLFVINVFLKNQEECFDSLVEVIKEAVNQVLSDDSTLISLRKQLLKAQKDVDKDLKAYRDAISDDMREDFKAMYDRDNARKKDIQRQIDEIEAQKSTMIDVEKEIRAIQTRIEQLKQIKVLDRTVVNNFINRIIIEPEGQIRVLLKFGVSTPLTIVTHYRKHPALKAVYVKFDDVKFLKDMTQEQIRDLILFRDERGCYKRDMTVHFVRDMPTVQRTCSQG